MQACGAKLWALSIPYSLANVATYKEKRNGITVKALPNLEETGAGRQREVGRKSKHFPTLCTTYQLQKVCL